MSCLLVLILCSVSVCGRVCVFVDCYVGLIQGVLKLGRAGGQALLGGIKPLQVGLD